MKTWHTYMLWVLVAVVSGLAVAACDPGPSATAQAVGPGEQTGEPDDERSDDASETEKTYSPFAVALEGYPGFDVISFKSVGLLGAIGGSETLVFEGLAQSLKRDLEAHADLDVSAEVYHDKSLAKPENHQSCEMRHIYADVWHSKDPERLGYSLWAGCSESDRFVWNEVPAADGDNSVVDELRPLTLDIADKLAEAQRGGCFQRRC